jgi:hypothetical protein
MKSRWRARVHGVKIARESSEWHSGAWWRTARGQGGVEDDDDSIFCYLRGGSVDDIERWGGDAWERVRGGEGVVVAR